MGPVLTPFFGMRKEIFTAPQLAGAYLPVKMVAAGSCSKCPAAANIRCSTALRETWMVTLLSPELLKTLRATYLAQPGAAMAALGPSSSWTQVAMKRRFISSVLSRVG